MLDKQISFDIKNKATYQNEFLNQDKTSSDKNTFYQISTFIVEIMMNWNLIYQVKIYYSRDPSAIINLLIRDMLLL